MTTDKRIEKMEGQLARMRWFNRCLIACIVLSLGVWFILKTFGPEKAWAQSGVKEIRANKFVLEDENGKDRAVLSNVENSGPRLMMFNEKGGPRAGLVLLGGRGSNLTLIDENRRPRAGLSVDKGEPRVWLRDKNGKPRAALTVTKDGPALSLSDENGKVIWRAP